jgi:hypothetical protein
VYHGWKFSIDGACVDMPNEPAESDFKQQVNATACQTPERGGVVGAYMGDRGTPPPRRDARRRSAAEHGVACYVPMDDEHTMNFFMRANQARQREMDRRGKDDSTSEEYRRFIERRQSQAQVGRQLLPNTTDWYARFSPLPIWRTTFS